MASRAIAFATITWRDNQGQTLERIKTKVIIDNHPYVEEDIKKNKQYDREFFHGKNPTAISGSNIEI